MGSTEGRGGPVFSMDVRLARDAHFALISAIEDLSKEIQGMELALRDQLRDEDSAEEIREVTKEAEDRIGGALLRFLRRKS